MRTESFPIRHYEINAQHILTPWGLQNFFQEAACIDADNLGFGFEALTPQNFAWVLTKLQINVLKPLKCKTVQVKTWVVEASKITSRRDFIFYDQDNRELACGSSEWVIIDLKTRRLVRIPQFILDGHPKDKPQYALEKDFLKIPSFEGIEPVNSCKIQTRLEDIDINNHVNNQHFTAWALQATPKEVYDNLNITYFAVYFKKEITLGETITVNAYKAEGENAFWYTLTNEEGKESGVVFAEFKKL